MPLQRRLPKRGFKSRAPSTTPRVTLWPTSQAPGQADEVDLLALKASGPVRRDGQDASRSSRAGELEQARSTLTAASARPKGAEGGDRSRRRQRSPTERGRSSTKLGQDRSQRSRRTRRATQRRQSTRPRAASTATCKRRLCVPAAARSSSTASGAHPGAGHRPDRAATSCSSGQQGGILGLFNMFSGGALSRFSSSRWASCRTSRRRSSCS